MNDLIKDIMDHKGVIVLSFLFLILFIAESIFQLRKRVQNRWKRVLMNTIVSIPAFAALRFLFIPVVVWIAGESERLNLGLNALYTLPAWLENVIAFMLLDYTNYIWHILLHKAPWLWRFHLVHHTDLDLDVTTAIRFHFGELIASVLFRGLAVMLIGASPLIVLVYEIVFECATQFHHSNWRLPFRLESILNKLIVTPRMHGIHHSIVKAETDSNYSIIFSFWDRFHRTIKLNVLQRHITIGVPSYREEKELTIGLLLMLPFRKVRSWGNDLKERNEGERGKLQE